MEVTNNKKWIPKAGHYCAVAFHGDNGDLIVGYVESIRASRKRGDGSTKQGRVVCRNLLTGHTSTKEMSVISLRNKRITKKQAHELIALWNETKHKASVRKAAVELPLCHWKEDKVVAPPPTTSPTAERLKIASGLVRVILTCATALMDQIEALEKLHTEQAPRARKGKEKVDEAQGSFIF